MLPMTVPYRDLECLLQKLGFHLGETAGSHQVYEQPDYEAVILLPPHLPDELVPSWHLLGARQLCDAKGILSREGFDQLLHNLTAPAPITSQAA